MRHSNRWIVVIMIMVAPLLAACAGEQPVESTEEEPAVLEPIGDTGINRVTLTARVAERLGIETAQVSEQLVTRARTVGGQVEALPEAEANASLVRVRVPLNASDMTAVARNQPVYVLSLDDDDDDDTDDAEEVGLEALEVDDLDDVNDVEDDDTDEVNVLYYEVNNADQRLTPGDRVRVRLSLAGSGEQRVVVPYSAVIYDLEGATWVYTSPEPLVFVREPITIDHIQGDLAVLSDGPAVGTAVATVGVAELYGTDTGVGR